MVGLKQASKATVCQTFSCYSWSWFQASLYVDDILLTSNNVNFINHLKHLLDAKFKLKYLGSVKYFLGIEVARSS